MNWHDCRKLRRAFDALLDRIGPAFTNIVYEELEKSGLSLQYPCSSLEEIEKALAKAFGREGAALLIQAVRKRLE